MSASLNTLVWHQFGAAIDMLGNVIAACPDELWEKNPEFCRLGHHTLFFLDYYLSDKTPMEADYSPPPPFTKSEFEEVVLPVQYTKDELLQFLQHGRNRLREQLSENNVEALLTKRFVSEYKDFSLFEMLLYNMRHVQHHAAQLNMILRQKGGMPPDWVSQAEEQF